MSKYNVLWFDDDFQPLIPNPDNEQKKINTIREALRRDAEKASDFDICVDCVFEKREFASKIKSYQRYQAVIFDLKGLNLDDSTDDNVMVDAYDIVKELPLAVYVYSGNPEDREFKQTLRKLREKSHVFGKLSDGIKPLFRKIIEDLDDELNYYEGHQECLTLFSEGYLNPQNKQAMDEILQKWSEHDKCYAPYNNMRKILEDMLNNLVQARIVKKGYSKDSFENFNQTMKNLTTNCHKKKNEKGDEVVDFENPYVPFSTCRREIRYILNYLCDITNRYSHFLENEPNYIRDDETIQDYNILIQESVYPAFFVAIKWYYATMSKL